jgi:CheY-like chemotaxis protein
MQSPEFEQLMIFHPSVKIELKLSDNLLNTKGSPTHLAKSITNLISNAAEAMPEGGKITVTTDTMYISQAEQGEKQFQVRGHIVLTVSDTGIGISAEDIKRIFEPFYTKKKMGRSGTGLGMAVIWGTVEDHNGFIDIKSREGKGTTITLFFPAFQQPVSPITQSPELDKFQGNNEAILVVDDDEVQREIAQNILIKLGYTVYTVASGREAVDFLQKNSVDLLVLDMIMDPEMDGLDTFRAITVMKPKQKIVIASGFSETDRVKELLAISGGQYIKKPYSISKIGRALKKSLSGDISSFSR